MSREFLVLRDILTVTNSFVVYHNLELRHLMGPPRVSGALLGGAG